MAGTGETRDEEFVTVEVDDTGGTFATIVSRVVTTVAGMMQPAIGIPMNEQIARGMIPAVPEPPEVREARLVAQRAAAEVERERFLEQYELERSRQHARALAAEARAAAAAPSKYERLMNGIREMERDPVFRHLERAGLFERTRPAEAFRRRYGGDERTVRRIHTLMENVIYARNAQEVKQNLDQLLVAIGRKRTSTSIQNLDLIMMDYARRRRREREIDAMMDVDDEDDEDDWRSL